MKLQGCWRLAASPYSSVGKSFACLRSCILLDAAAAPSLRSVIAPLAVFHHAPLLYPPLGRRGLCWVRRTPPFPRSAAPRASLVQDLTDKKHLPLDGLAEEDHLSFSGAAHVLLAANSNGDVDNADAFGLSCDADINIANGLGHLCDDNADGPSAVNCLISQGPCDTTTTGGSSTAPQSLIGLVESSVNTSRLSIATPRGKNFLSSANKEASGLHLTKTESLKGPQLRRMLKLSHAIVREDRDEKMQWFPYLDQFKVKDKVLTSTQIMQMLGPYMLEDRKDRIKRVVANRTYAVCTVVEGLLDLGNIAAIFRSADALGFQSVHVISNETVKRYKKNRKISLGSEKWLDAELFAVTEDCFEELHARGYRIAVANLSADSVPICDMDWTIPTAVVFGNEYRGISTEALQLADLSCYIPMEGMVDSFNVSVAAGIVMHHAVNDRKSRLGRHGDLSEEEQRILSADFYLRHSSRSLSVIEQMLQKRQEERQTDLRSILMGELDLNTELQEHIEIDLEEALSKLDSI